LIYLYDNRGTVLNDLDETLDLIDNAGVSTEHLFESILQSPSLQKSLRELDDPKDITTIYVNYWKEDRGMSLERFAETEVKVMNEVGAGAKLDEFAESAFDTSGKLKPNVRFKTGEFGYIGETDSLGRLSKAKTSELKISEIDRLKHATNTPGKMDGDHAGHLFGDRFGGSPELDNLVSQASNVNLSTFKKIENQWAKDVLAGKKVKVEIKVNYKGDTFRPSSFEVSWSVNGEEFYRLIKNK